MKTRKKIELDRNLLEALIIEAINHGYTNIIWRKYTNPGQNMLSELKGFNKEKFNMWFLGKVKEFAAVAWKTTKIYNKVQTLKRDGLITADMVGAVEEIERKYGALIRLGLKPMKSGEISGEPRNGGSYDCGPAFGDTIAENALLMLRLECGLATV